MTGTDHFETFPAADGWRWRLVAANGEVVAQSEGYTTATDAERGARTAAQVAGGAALAPVIPVTK